MREGKCFKKYFDLLYSTKIDTSLIYASRKSTYLPSLDLSSLNFNELFFIKDISFTIEDIYNVYLLEIDNEILFTVNEKRKAEEVEYIIVDEQTKIKILPYSIIYAKDFTPVSTYITE